MNKERARWHCGVLVCQGLVLYSVSAATLASNVLETMDQLQQGRETVVRFTLSEPLAAQPPNFALARPRRAVIDLPGTISRLGFRRREMALNGIRGIEVIEDSSRLRLVLNLEDSASHAISARGRFLDVVVRTGGPAAAQRKGKLRDIDFRRGAAGEARILVSISDPDTQVDMRQQGQTIVVDFVNTRLPSELRRRLDVADFATPVSAVNAFEQGDNVRLVIEPKGRWENIAYQSDGQFVVEVRAVKEDAAGASGRRYTGERMSLNFQNVEVRSVLNVLADFTNLNIVTSDSVSGAMTLRLQDVPWDQALEIILQSRGLDSRRTGNVLWIAPRDEIATREKLALEAQQQIGDLEPLRTESFQLNYQKGGDVQKLLSDPTQRMLSKRGSAVVDVRTNTLFVQDTPSRLEDVRKLIAKIDVPVRQVMIEARIVQASDTFSRNLGVRLGFNNQSGGNSVGGARATYGTGSLENLAATTGQASASSSPVTDSLGVDLPATGLNGFNAGAFSFVLFNSAMTRFLNLEISALEADGKGKIIASPRVLTADQVEALIEQGTEIPYQQATSSGATSVSFRKANLSLKVKPHITPDGNISMTLDVNNDAPGTTTSAGVQINTKHVKTEVLVQNGGTVVIGGIYEETVRTDITKIPVLGDLPYLGALFRNKASSSTRTEMLVFITPRVANAALQLK